MNNKLTFLIGIVGASLFIISSILGGLLIDNYSIISQYISESYAIDTEYGMVLRTFGYIPSGIFIAIFCFTGVRFFAPTKLLNIGFYGIGLFYGLATVVVGMFPCDSGCNKDFIDPSTSQLIHNFMGLLTYLFVPVLIILIGLELKKIQKNTVFPLQSIVLGVISFLFVSVLFLNSNSKYIGLYQRIIELVFILWVVFCAIAIKNEK
mgnify:FL=1|jgi:hypothetical protein